jgi:hypothetical protein
VNSAAAAHDAEAWGEVASRESASFRPVAYLGVATADRRAQATNVIVPWNFARADRDQPSLTPPNMQE